MQSGEPSGGKPRHETLNIRIRPEERSLIDRAIVSANPADYARFIARLDAPPDPNERLRRTMQTRRPWDGE